ncbi:MAG: nitrous oxide reductase family maturation protein NosD, partial [Acidimicrobiia bacterium]
MRLAALALLIAVTAALPSWGAASHDLQEAIDLAPAGSTVPVPAGIHGPVSITKPLRLVGEPGAILDGGGNGTVIAVRADDVTVQGLTIRNSGDSLEREHSGVFVTGARPTIADNTFEDVLFGVYIRHGVGSVVSGNLIGAKDLGPGRRGDPIKLWGSPGSQVIDNTVAYGRDVVLWYSEESTVRRNTITGGRYGLHFMYSHDATVEHNTLADNSVGAFLMYSYRLTFNDNIVTGNHGPSGYGLGLKDVDGVEAHRNRFVGNRIGVYLDNSPTALGVEQHFTGNLFAHNDQGVTLQPAISGNVFTNNAFVENREQVGVNGSGTPSENAWALDGVGNHWSDFVGYDADGDGIGDMAHQVNDLFSSLTDGSANLMIFSGSPAARVIDAAARAFPSLRPEPKAVDPSPLVALPDWTTAERDDSASGATAVAALVLLGTAAALL